MDKALEAPIFIGGTGRSGTTILSVLLNQHPEVLSIKYELRLIVEVYGLIGLMAPLSEKWGMGVGHLAIKNFIFFTQQLRHQGYHNPILKHLGWLRGSKKEKFLLKFFPTLRYSVTNVASCFGLAHYDACVQRLLDHLIYTIDTNRPQTELGIYDPFYVTNRFERSALLECFRQFLAELYGKPLAEANKNRWCDDTPRNFMHVDFLLALYPQMKFIHMVRDPRDVVASYSIQRWTSREVEVNTHVIRNNIQAWLALRSQLPAACYLEVRLEDLAQQPEATLRGICDFLHLAFHDNMLSVALNKSHTGRYRQDLAPPQIRAIEVALKDWMTEKGYL
jgi:hypothetical protein